MCKSVQLESQVIRVEDHGTSELGSGTCLTISLAFQEPRKVTGTYVAGDGAGEDAAKAFVSVNWVLTEEPLDVEAELAFGFLDYLLLVCILDYKYDHVAHSYPYCANKINK